MSELVPLETQKFAGSSWRRKELVEKKSQMTRFEPGILDIQKTRSRDREGALQHSAVAHRLQTLSQFDLLWTVLARQYAAVCLTATWAVYVIVRAGHSDPRLEAFDSIGAPFLAIK